MKATERIYDKNGTLLISGDLINDGYDINELYDFEDTWYIAGNKDMWKLEQFNLETYKDGYLLVDFELEFALSNARHVKNY